MKKVILLLITLIPFYLVSFSQIIIRGTGSLPPGGVSGTPTRIQVTKSKTEQEKIDEATIRCYYKFTQPVTVEKEKLQQADTLTLDIGSKVSVYYDGMRMQRDSLFGAMMSEQVNPNTIQSISVLKDQDASSFDSSQGTSFERTNKGETAKIYKYRHDGEIVVVDRNESSIELYQYTEKEVPVWNITSDTLTVLGYTCQKATTDFHGRTYEAWFAPDVPVNDGPWKFYGLPGLVLKATDSENLFTFEIIGLEQLATPRDIVWENGESIKTNRKDLAKLKKRQSGGMSVNINGGNVTMIRKENKNEYTPLETE